MYCKNCGKLLIEGDKFCSDCGAKVELVSENTFFTNKDQSTGTEERPKKPVRREEFNWDLDGYPTEKTKKTDDISFNWDSVVEEKQRRLFEGKTGEKHSDIEEELQSEAEDKSLEEVIFGDIGVLYSDEPTKIVETGNKSQESSKVDKFYTFNKKNEEFQALLDEEYEKIQNGDEEEEKEANFEPLFKMEQQEADVEIPEPLTEEPVAEPVEENFPSEDQNVVFEEEVNPEQSAPLLEPLDIDVSQEVETIMAESEIEEETETEPVTEEEPEEAISTEPESLETTESEIEPEEEMEKPVEDDVASVVSEEELSGKLEETEPVEDSCPPSESPETEKEAEPQRKLTFDDVFGDHDDVDEIIEKPKKKNKALKIIAIVLCVCIALELCLIGVMYFGKGTPLAEKLNDGYLNLVGLLSGKDEKKEMPKALPQVSDISKAIEQQLGNQKNIGAIKEKPTMVFDDKTKYELEEVTSAAAFANRSWYTDDDGNSISYADEIVGTVIGYYSGWIDKSNGKSENKILQYVASDSDLYGESQEIVGEANVEYGINKLEIGEIREGDKGFYILTAITKIDSKTKKETIEKNIIYMEPMEKTMKIANINII